MPLGNESFTYTFSTQSLVFELLKAGMRKGKKNLVRSLCTIFLIILIPLSMNPQQQDISEYEKRLEKIASQIENLKSKIKREEQRESSILAQLGKLGFQKKLIRNEISLYNTQLSKAQSELTAVENKIPKIRAKLEQERSAVEQILVTLYKYGRLKHIELMLLADNVGTLLSDGKNLKLLAGHQEKVIDSFLKNLNDLDQARRTLEDKKTEIDGFIQKAQEKKQELDNQEKKNQALIQTIQQNQKTHLKTLEELKERAEQLQSLMNKLTQEKMALPFALIPLYERKGRLSWPLTGKTITRFGLKRHPKFNTITMNNGIEISAPKNAVVKSIHPGLVVYTDYFQGYGNLIILDHGMSYYSLYGHCSDFLVNKGDAVPAEQPIAVVGDIGSLTGITLYFEIRYKTKPLNPLQWLKRR